MNPLQEHHEHCEAMLNKYLGTACLMFGRNINAKWNKYQWYMNRLVDLGREVGYQRQRQYRCKRTDSKVWEHCRILIDEIETAIHALQLELLELLPPEAF
jgi:hypothetical protein